MSGVNKAILLGNLGRDPETRYLPNGDSVTNISIATSQQWKDKDGERQEKTEWHRVTLFRKLAELAAEYLKKGSQVYIEGRIEYREYEKDGVKRYSTDIIAEHMTFISTPRDKDGGERVSEGERSRAQEPARAAAPAKKKTDDFDDDIPFS